MRRLLQDEINELRPWSQVCVWPGTTMDDTPVEDFVQFFKENFGVRVQFCEEVETLPDRENGIEVPETGGRHDVFFRIHEDDMGSFAIMRLNVGIRWWEDVVGNGSHKIYPKEVLEKYPRTW